jgi:hypothetical protein
VTTGSHHRKHPYTIAPRAVFLAALAIVLFLGIVYVIYPRSPAADATGSINQCPARNHNYSPTNLAQCVNACMSCDAGTIITCSTSCRLKGAS